MATRVTVSLAVLLIFGVSASAQPLDSDRLARQVEELLDAGADGAALADLATAPVEGEMVQALGAERSGLLQTAWAEAFRADAVRSDVVAFVAGREARQDVAAALEWLRRPEVQRATSRMRESGGSDFDREFGEWMIRVRDGQVRLDTARVQQIILISERSGEQRIGEVVTALAEASIRGGHAIAPRGDRPPLEPALERLRAVGPTLAAQAVVQNQLYLYYVLRDLTPQQLAAYAAALDRPEARWYVRTMANAVEHAIGAGSQRLLSEIAARAPRR